MTTKPGSVWVNKKKIPEGNSKTEDSWSWKPLNRGGVLAISHVSGNRIVIMTN